MSLKARIRGLDARVEWLQDWGKLRKLAQQMRYLAAKKKIVDRAPELAVSLGLMPAPKPAPQPALPPKRESFAREDPRPSGIPRANSVPRPDSHATPPASECATETSQGEAASAPGDASAHDALPGGIVPRPPPRASPAPPDQPVGQPLVQPFVPFQNGLIRWRQRGPEDDWEDDEPLEDEDYDPLAVES